MSVDALIRVDQVGFAPDASKSASLMATAPMPGAGFSIVDGSGRTVFSGRASDEFVAWSEAYPAVHVLDFSSLTESGAYRIVVDGVPDSPHFRVAPLAELYIPIAADMVAFFQAQRDGADVIPGELDRRPAHLSDTEALIYPTPTFEGDDDVPVELPLDPIAGPVDVEGGWFDAGDYLKFTYTTAYSLAALLIARRASGDGVPGLAAETEHGLRWMRKMWDGETLLLQVGLGVGTDGVLGDHEVWRLPEEDDALDGDASRFLARRPVYRAAEPGEPLSPNLAGYVAAVFALEAQLLAATDPSAAKEALDRAAAAFAKARTEDVDAIVTVAPWSYYPGESWRDALELGAAELALAARALGDPRETEWREAAVRWAREGLGKVGPISVYDVAGLAHAELALVLGDEPESKPLLEQVAADLRTHLSDITRLSDDDPFRVGIDPAEFDVVPHAFGVAIVAELYRRITGDGRFAPVTAAHLGWAFGGNAWGTGFVVGVGETYPRFLSSQIPNLAGEPRGRVLRGAVVNGPNGLATLEDRVIELTETFISPDADPDRFRRFDGRGAMWVDDVRYWMTAEPANDFVATALLALVLASTSSRGG